ncbi:hypothetical protein [Wenjunlia tyrosinilytica]|uniref:Uncharacterized protein n=1 Tax=Wenjunlia tyrosinilytica TaxID=1544741 RepID=A0A918E190_9ACTN|nr:hypothetical protein [Wenjunlia tyrosinilytica]GGO99608.1 hypothetical protein GCM10012280_66440 [Wenjunlia tyrosinilytica]
MEPAIRAAVRDARAQLASGTWQVTEADRASVRELLTVLGKLPDAQRAALPLAARLEQLREAVAATAVASASSSGQLAWFLGKCITAFTPVTHWEAEPGGTGRAYGSTVPTPDQVTDAERAFTLLRALLATAHHQL